MIKNFFLVSITLIIFFFFFFVVSTYVSKNSFDTTNINKKLAEKKIEESLDKLPILLNNTSDVIHFNSGYDDNSNKIKRKFWDLLKK
tara:strand:- start:350 stop:610 length:261 start_codon:yes stop_codon:yes gene_type:complete